jgi:hypothetical protein
VPVRDQRTVEVQPNRGHEKGDIHMTDERDNAGVVAPPPLIYGGPLLAARSLKGATMPNGQKYEEWLKSKGHGEDSE